MSKYPTRPFSNGTEGMAWQSKWCWSCVHDHEMSHGPDESGTGCPLLGAAIVWQQGDPPPAGTEWVDQPEGEFYLPSLMVCLRYEPCHKGTCDGDPDPEVRDNVRAHTLGYWRERETMP